MGRGRGDAYAERRREASARGGKPGAVRVQTLQGGRAWERGWGGAVCDRGDRLCSPGDEPLERGGRGRTRARAADRADGWAALFGYGRVGAVYDGEADLSALVRFGA